jgi:protein gp37
VWLGTSIENDRYTFRASHLRATPAAVRFLSLEPLLGPLPSLDLAGIGWVIVGGESGSGARPMHPDWVRDLRDRCVAAGVPFFFKQWGAWVQSDREPGLSPASRARFRLVHARPNRSDRALYMEDVGKRAAGRVLDGRTWDGMPAQGAA